MLFFAAGPQGNYARIYQDNSLIESINLSNVATPFSKTIGDEAGYNIIAVENGRIRITEANCPDRTCIHQGWISDGALPIVCLPHRLVIRLDNNSEPDLDAVIG